MCNSTGKEISSLRGIDGNFGRSDKASHKNPVQLREETNLHDQNTLEIGEKVDYKEDSMRNNEQLNEAVPKEQNFHDKNEMKEANSMIGNVTREDSEQIEGPDICPLLRKPVIVDEEGWCSAFSGSSNKSTYTTTNSTEEISQNDVSEFRNDLVCRSFIVNSSVGKKRTSYVSKKAPNFKRFRKNQILRSKTALQLKTVLPKQTELQRSMELTQKELDREKDAAEVLFNDNLPMNGLGKFGFSQRTKTRNAIKNGRRRR